MTDFVTPTDQDDPVPEAEDGFEPSEGADMDERPDEPTDEPAPPEDPE